jgi:1,4-dihydroxy-2-naphthoyl-CoA synthase
LALGLLGDVAAEGRLLDTGFSLADEMLQASPHGLRMTKQALNLNIDAPGLDGGRD